MDIAVLGNRSDTSGQAAGQSDQYIFHRGSALVFSGKNLRVVCVKLEAGFVLLLFTQTEIALYLGAAMGAIYPVAGGTPLELRSLRCCSQRFLGLQ